jgi:hypothetical protein
MIGVMGSSRSVLGGWRGERDALTKRCCADTYRRPCLIFAATHAG